MPPHQYFYEETISRMIANQGKEDLSPHEIRLSPAGCQPSISLLLLLLLLLLILLLLSSLYFTSVKLYKNKIYYKNQAQLQKADLLHEI